MKYCVKCGREVSIDEYINEYSLCIDCYLKHRGIFKTRLVLELVSCPKCSKWKINSEWVEVSFNEAIRRSLLNTLSKYVDQNIYVADIIVSNEIKKIHRNRFEVSIDISAIIGERSSRVVNTYLECVLVKKPCPKCIAYSSRKHSVCVQIRSENGVVSDETKSIIERIISEQAVLNDIIEFTKNKYGFDIKFYSINIAKKFISDFVKTTGARIVESFKPIRYDGKSGKWRGVLTVSLRTPSIDKGDLAEYRGEPVIIRKIEPFKITIEFLRNGSLTSIDYNSYWSGLLKKTSEIYYYKKYTVVGFDKTTIYLMSDDGEFREFSRSEGVRDINNGDTVFIVVYKNREYLVKK